MSFINWMLGAAGFCCSLISYLLISQGYVVLDVIDRVLVKLELKLIGKYDCVPADGETEVSVQNTRASWQLKKENVGVFAIQGRRTRMEDRFNVVSNMEHTGTSIYGIFDGHGGEVKLNTLT
jgi:protein phosphatase 1L